MDALASRPDATAGHLERGEFCAARADADGLRREAIAVINEGAVPADLQEALLGSVNAITEGVSCTPPAANDGAADAARDLADWLRRNSG